MLARFGPQRVIVLDGGRDELAARLLDGDVPTEVPALVMREDAGYYVLDHDELRELDRFVELRRRAGTLPRTVGDVIALIAARLPFSAAVAVAPGARPAGRAVEVAGGRVVAVWAHRSEGLDTLGAQAPAAPAASAAAPAGDPTADAGVIRRTPHLGAPDDLDTTAGAGFEVSVWTDRAPPRDDEESDEVVIEPPPGVTAVELGVLLRTSPHFRVRGPYFRMLHVERDREDSEPVRFSVEVVKPHEPGPAALDATLHYEGRDCGRVRKAWSWPEGRVSAAPRSTSGGVSVTAGAKPPDLSVSVTSPTNDDRQQWSVCAPDVPGLATWTQPQDWSSRTGTAGFLADALDAFVDPRRAAADRRAELRKAGRAFWKAAAPVFHDALWALIDSRQGRAERASVYVATDDPLLPWELMLPAREKADGTPDERPRPLGVEFAVGRRLRGDRRPPPDLLPVRDSVLIAAKYDEPRRLDPRNELEVLARHFAGRLLPEATKTLFRGPLGDNGASLVHFTCHGEATSDSEQIYLDGDEPYSSDDVRDSEWFRSLCASRHPIVFLNACDAGRGRVTIGPGGAGFPQAFTELGARAVIAPLWPVSVRNAPKVAVELYSRAASEPDRRLADILADLRERSYSGPDEAFDDSWAAYCFYGDPCAPLRREGC